MDQIGGQHARNGAVGHAVAGESGGDIHVGLVHGITPDEGKSIDRLDHLARPRESNVRDHGKPLASPLNQPGIGLFSLNNAYSDLMRKRPMSASLSHQRRRGSGFGEGDFITVDFTEEVALRVDGDLLDSGVIHALGEHVEACAFGAELDGFDALRVAAVE